VTEGAPEYKPIGTDLLYVDNSESDVLVEIATQRHFVLLSGRWFAAPGFDGPWTFVASDTLPESFQAIPEDSAVGHLRVWVSGTDKVNEVVLDASIPQTAAIPRDATTRSSMTFYKIDKRVSSEVSRPIARRAARLEGAVFVVLSFVCLVHFCAGHGVTRGKRSRFHTRSVSRGDLARHVKYP